MVPTLAAGPISQKLEAMGGPARFGNPTANPTTLNDGHTTLQSLTQGAVFYNRAYGAFVMSPAISGLRILSGADATNSATRAALTLAAGAVVKILPFDWTPANIAKTKTPVIVRHLDQVGGYRNQ